MTAKIKAFFSTKTLHPYLVCLFFVLSGYRKLIKVAQFKDAVFAFFILSLGSFLAYQILKKFILKDKFRTAIWLSIALIFSLFFIQIYKLGLELLHYHVFARRIILVFVSLILLGFLFYFIKSKKQFTSLTLFLNVVFAVYCLWEMLQISFVKAQNQAILSKISPNEVENQAKLPNIYLLVLDGYAKSENLKKYWNFDNSPFVDSLTKQGFFNIKNSKSAYPYTIETISSIFNLGKIETVYEGGKQHDDDKEVENELLLQEKMSSPNGNLLSTLRTKGYDFKNLSLFYYEGYENPFNSYNNLLNFYKEMSILDPLLKYYGAMSSKETTEQFEMLDQIAANSQHEKPFFLYLHSMKTHSPFFLDENGNFSYSIKNNNFSIQEWWQYFENNDKSKPIDKAILARYEVWKKAYLNHIRSSTRETIASISVILKNDPTAIICLMSDHGFRHLNENDAKINFQEKYENIEFVYFPDKNYQNLNDSLNSTEIIKRILEK